MSITKKFANIFAGVVVALVAFGMMASTAAAAFSASQQAALQVAGFSSTEITALGAILGGGTSGGSQSPATCVAVDTSSTLGIQTAINQLGYAPALTEDGAYGPKTTQGVMWAQAKVGAGVDGKWGPITTAAYEGYVASTCEPEPEPEPEPTNLPEGCESTEGFSTSTGNPCDEEPTPSVDGCEEGAMFSSETGEPCDDGGTPSNPKTLSGGEASLEDFDMSSDDDAEEGEEKHVATIEFDVEDGDAMIDRLDLSFFPSDAPSEDEPWDSFDTITLMVGGDEIASEDVDDEDDWLEEDYNDEDTLIPSPSRYGDDTEDSAYVYRLSGLDYVVEQGDSVEIEVYLTAASNVDDAGTDAEWEIFVDGRGIRAVDSEGIQNYIGDEDDVVLFEIDTEGGDESLDIQSSSDDPDKATLIVDNDDDSDWYEVFVFALEAEENDMDVDEIVLTVDTDTEDYEDVVNDAKLVIDGEDFDDFTVTNGGSTTATLTFDIDKDFTVDADDTVDVALELEFQDTNSQARYANGETITAATVSVDSEGADDYTDTATVTGETHVLIAEGLVDDFGTKDSDAQDLGDDTIAVFEFSFDLEAVEDTFYIAEDQGIGTEANGFGVTVSNGTITDVTVSATSANLVAGGTAYEIVEGSSESFTVEITVVSDAVAGTAQAIRATIADITYDDESGLAGTDATLDLGAPDYRSGSVTVIDAN